MLCSVMGSAIANNRRKRLYLRELRVEIEKSRALQRQLIDRMGKVSHDYTQR